MVEHLNNEVQRFRLLVRNTRFFAKFAETTPNYEISTNKAVDNLFFNILRLKASETEEKNKVKELENTQV